MAGVNVVRYAQRSPVMLSSVIAFVLSLYIAAPAQGQLPEDFFDLPGVPPPGRSTGRAVATLCPQLSPNATGATGDLQIRCTELIGNTLGGNTSDVANPLLQMAPEEVATQGSNSVETSNKNIGARLAALRAGATGISLQRFALNVDGPTPPGTMVASLDPSAAVSSAGSTNTPNPFKKIGVFANGILTLGDKDATSREAGFDFDTLGVTVGIDYRFTNNFVLGVAFSYASTDTDLDKTNVLDTSAGGGIDTESFGLSVYTTYYISNFYVDGIGSFGWNDYDIDRDIIYSVPATDRAGNLIPGTATVRQTARGNTDGTQYSLSFGTGYDFSTGGFTFGPFARVNYIMVDIDGYREEIDNTDPGFGLVLEFESQDVESLTSVVGAQASYAISTGLGVLLPQVRFEWEHEFKDESRTITARFVADPTRTPIEYVTDNPDRDFFNVGVGLSAIFRVGLSAFVHYETVLGLEDVTVHDIVLGVRKEL